MKIKRRKKSRRQQGSQTHGRGAKERTRGSGSRGGKGMAGTGKRADHRKSYILNIYGNDYFGGDKTLRRGKPHPKLSVINIGDVQTRLAALKSENGIIDLSSYKILGTGKVTAKLKIKAAAASASAIDKVKQAGGEIIFTMCQEPSN